MAFLIKVIDYKSTADLYNLKPRPEQFQSSFRAVQLNHCRFGAVVRNQWSFRAALRESAVLVQFQSSSRVVPGQFWKNWEKSPRFRVIPEQLQQSQCSSRTVSEQLKGITAIQSSSKKISAVPKPFYSNCKRVDRSSRAVPEQLKEIIAIQSSSRKVSAFSEQFQCSPAMPQGKSLNISNQTQHFRYFERLIQRFYFLPFVLLLKPTSY